MYFLNVGGLASIVNGNIYGVNIGGLVLISVKSNINGLNLTAGKIAAKYGSVDGISFAGYNTEAKSVFGLNCNIAWSDIENLHGVSIASYNQIDKVNGLTIGIVNIADDLSGVMLGLLNIVKNNPSPFKILPLINVGL